MTYQEPQSKTVDHTEAFIAMADRIKKNSAEDFAGAFVIVSPDGTTKQSLILDNSQSAAAFWGVLMSTAQIALAEIEAHERGVNPYGRR
jgi:hypothetical protein